jgi:hypothetical protein
MDAASSSTLSEFSTVCPAQEASAMATINVLKKGKMCLMSQILSAKIL